jgi:hypothetical protein
MKNIKRKKLIIVIIFLLLISILLVVIYKSIRIYGWDDFKKNTINKYSFVNNVTIDSINPIQINIVYKLNRNLNNDEINSIFENTITYLSSEKTFTDLINYHKKTYDCSFGKIKIILFKWNQTYEINIESHQNVDGEPKYYNFTDWIIEYNNGVVENYKKITY